LKIGFDNVDMTSRSGPNSFAYRLAMELTKMGHAVDPQCQGCDVVLAFIERRTVTKDSTKVVQRLDGIWFSPQEFHIRNEGIKSLYTSCNRVVWQSRFDRHMTEKWWGPRSGTVIHNGIEAPADVVRVGVKWGAQAMERVFVSCANWHPQKRLKANIELFAHVHETQFPQSCMFVIGTPDTIVKHPRVRYVGDLPGIERDRLLRASDWFIHLAWLDHCPNSVIEALSAGCQVIASDSGGTAEVLDPKVDVIISERQAYDFRLAKYDEPPSIDVTQVPSLASGPRRARAPNISDVAKQYLRTFEEIA
jgi:glycosyltransferase involved in cell wall biosynthesis